MSINAFLEPEFLLSRRAQEALTHCSIRQKSTNDSLDNERLEWLGDAILDYLITAYLFNLFQKLSGWKLSRIRAHLVCNRALSSIAREWGVGEWLILGPTMNTDNSPSVAGNAFEALLGAIWCAQGLPSTWAFITNTYNDRLARNNLLSVIKNTARPSSTKNQPTETSRLADSGNKILKYLISIYLFKRFPKAEEGVLSKFRDHLSCKKTRRVLSENLSGKKKQYRQYAKEDICVLTVGEIWQDRGLAAAWDFLASAYGDLIEIDKRILKNKVIDTIN